MDNFADLSVWRFTDKEFQRFKQVAILGIRKHREIELLDTSALEQNAVHPDSIPNLEEIQEGRYPCHRGREDQYLSGLLQGQ